MKKFLKNTAVFFKSRPYSLILLAWPFQWLWYGLLNSSQTLETSHVIYMKLDDAIPFIPEFILPYVMWYFYIAFAALYTLWKSKKDFLHMMTMVYFGMFGSLAFSTVYPSWHLLRPDYSEIKGGIFTFILKQIWAIDNPAVIYPSMHVLVAVLITIAFFRADCMKGKGFLKGFFVFYTILVSASTVFTKQHSVKDIFFAFAFVVPYYLLTYYVIWPKKRFKDRGAKITPLKEKETAEV
ncbi:MAG: hypothetical protein WC143_03315 [Eubacteriales bacterium]